MNNIGAMYENGDAGLTKDRDTAISWYRKAAKLGVQKAKENLRRLGVPE